MKIIIDATLYPDETIVNSICKFGKGHDLILLIDHKSRWEIKDFGDNYNSLRLVHYNSFRSFATFDINIERSAETITLVQEIMNDHITLCLSNRYGRFGNYGPGIFHYIRYLTAFVSNVFQFLQKESPDFVFFRSTPHSLQEWPFALVAEYLNIPVLITERSVIPWRLNLNKGFKKKRELVMPFKDGLGQDINEVQFVDTYFSDSQSSYEKVLPLSDKVRLKRNKNKVYNLRVELKQWWKRPDKMWNKYQCYKACVNFSKNAIPKGDYFVFFMHYQPERTSLPEGYGFSQQILAIQALRIALPTHIHLVVKEHPSIFTNQCTVRDRHPSFYEDIANISNVTLINVEHDTFELMDNSVGIATITGTSGRQGMLRNKPVVFFGRSIYNGIDGTHEYSTMEALKDFLNNLDKYKSNDKILENVKNEFVKCLSYSFPPIKSDFTNTTNYFERKLVLDASENVLNQIFQGKLQF